MNAISPVSSAPLHAGATGIIQATIDAGIPASLLIPVAPASSNCKAPGKMPAIQDGDRWVGLRDWVSGVDISLLEAADRCGANVGLRCGAPASGYVYYLIDLDVQWLAGIPNASLAAHKLCAVVEECLAEALGVPFWTRRTHPYRGMVAIAVPASAPYGGKVVRDFKSGAQLILKIELLGYGQQGVIGGSHVGGPIYWTPHGEPEERSPTLSLARDAVPLATSYEAVVGILDAVSLALTTRYPLTVARTGIGRAVDRQREDDVIEVPVGEAPPGGVDQLVGVLNHTTNGPHVSYEVYAAFMMSTVGSIQALQRTGNIDADGIERIGKAACRWAARWGGPTTYEDEVARFESEWLHARVRKRGWQTLLPLAQDLTPNLASQFANEDAVNVFAPVPLQPGCDADTPIVTPAAGSKPGLQFGRLRVLSMADIGATPARDYLIKGLISPSEMSVWWGPPKSGKSFLMLRVAHMVAQGRSVFGRRVRSGPVLYVAGEGVAGLAGRLKALCDKHGGAPNLYLIAQPLDLLHADADLKAVREAALRVGAKLIVLDTLARMMAGGDENGPQDMGRFIANVGELQASTGAHVAIVHHGTKNPAGSTPRGHSSLIGAADLVVEVARCADGLRTAKITAAKDDADGAVMAFRLDMVNLGTDADGDPHTTCLAVESGTPAVTAEPAVTAAGKKSLNILRDLIRQEGVAQPLGDKLRADPKAVTETRWREECYNQGVSSAESKENRNRVFRRLSDVLVKKGLIETQHGSVWVL